MESGQLVSDEIMCEMLIDHIKTIPSGKPWVIDGFPRTMDQATFLKNRNDINITHVITLNGDEDEITQRLSGRLYDPETGSTYHKETNPPPEDIRERCITRKDDQPEVIANRFETFRKSVDVINAIFSDLLSTIECAGQSIDSISEKIRSILHIAE